MTANRIVETPFATTADRIGLAFAGILYATMTAVAGWWRRRQAIRQLSEADDFLLRDMGITRGGIEGAVRHGRR